MKQLSDLRKARGLIQRAYSKILGRFGTHTEILELLSEALVLIKGADVPGGVIEVSEEVPASSNTTSGEPVTGSSGDGAIEVGTQTTTNGPPSGEAEEAEPRPEARKRKGRKK